MAVNADSVALIRLRPNLFAVLNGKILKTSVAILEEDVEHGTVFAYLDLDDGGPHLGVKRGRTLKVESQKNLLVSRAIVDARCLRVEHYVGAPCQGTHRSRPCVRRADTD